MYSEFLTLVHSGNVRTAGIDDQADKIYFSLNGHSSQQAAEQAGPVSAQPQPEVSTSSVDTSSGELLSSLWLVTKAVFACIHHSRPAAQAENEA